MHQETTLFVTRPDHITVKSKFSLQSHSTEKVRAAGNDKFKKKQYIEALCDYEFSLGLSHQPDNKR